MNERYEQRLLSFKTRGGNWLQRAAFGFIALAVFVLAFFFITIALAAGAVLAVVIAARWWWITRRLRAALKAAAPLEGAYRVVDSDRVPERARQIER
jgi:hypothetical protein